MRDIGSGSKEIDLSLPDRVKYQCVGQAGQLDVKSDMALVSCHAAQSWSLHSCVYIAATIVMPATSLARQVDPSNVAMSPLVSFESIRGRTVHDNPADLLLAASQLTDICILRESGPAEPAVCHDKSGWLVDKPASARRRLSATVETCLLPVVCFFPVDGRIHLVYALAALEPSLIGFFG